MSVQDFPHAVSDTEVCTVYVPGHDEQDGNRQVVVGHIGQP
jgi:hypothetical protein